MTNHSVHHVSVSRQEPALKISYELFRYRLESSTYRVIEVTANEAAIAPLLRMKWVILEKRAILKEVA